MHWPAQDGTLVEEYWQLFADLRREGKIRAAGLSNHVILQLEAAEEVAAVDARSPGQVDGWLPAATLELKDDDLADVAAAIRATGAGAGPTAPAR